MADPDVVPLKLTKPAASRIIKEIAADPNKIVPVSHAKKRMVQRKISITQARRVVQAGFIDGEPWKDERGNWRVIMRGTSAGEQITVGISIEWRTRLLIVTVF